LGSVLQVHLASEDKTLYPALMAHQNTKIQKLAIELFVQEGSLKDKLIRFLATWSNEASIEEDASWFCELAGNLVAALRRRVEREDCELFALVRSEQQAHERPAPKEEGDLELTR